MVMETRGRIARCVMGAALSAALVTAGCRQPEGRMPTPTGEQPNKIVDISRDLQNVADARPDAVRDLSDDLANLGESEAAPPELLLPLTDGVSAAIRQKRLTDTDARHLANLLFITVAARDLNPTQIDRLKVDVHGALVAIGAPPAAATQAADAAAALQRDVTENRKRWYHLF